MVCTKSTTTTCSTNDYGEAILADPCYTSTSDVCNDNFANSYVSSTITTEQFCIDTTIANPATNTADKNYPNNCPEILTTVSIANINPSISNGNTYCTTAQSGLCLNSAASPHDWTCSF